MPRKTQSQPVVNPTVVEDEKMTVRPTEMKSIAIRPVPVLMVTIEEARQRLADLRRFVTDMMVPGEDYGLIPGCNKPSLLKPGAEKLCDIFGFSKQITVLDKVEDWDKGLFAYTIKATLVSKHSGLIEADGLGSCNSKEKRYRNQDSYTIANTVLKMAKKRALVDAVLSATRSSGLFTQDVEDMDSSPPVQNVQPNRNPQLKEVYSLVKKLQMPPEEARKLIADKYGASNSSDLSSEQVADLLQHLSSINRTNS